MPTMQGPTFAPGRLKSRDSEAEDRGSHPSFLHGLRQGAEFLVHKGYFTGSL